MDKDLSRLIGEIYESSLDPSYWEVALETLSKQLKAKSAALFAHDKDAGRKVGVYTYGAPKATKWAYNLGLGNWDYAYKKMRNTQLGRAYNIISAADVKTEAPIYYHALLKPAGVDHIAAISIEDTEDFYYAIGVHRGVGTVPFEKECLDLLDLLHPHFERAIRIQREFHRLKIQNLRLESSLSTVLVGIVVLDNKGEIFFENYMARKIMNAHPAIDRRNGRVITTISADQQQLDDAINHAQTLDIQTAGRVTQAIVLQHKDGKSALSLLIGPVDQLDLDDLDMARSKKGCIIILSDPEFGCNIDSRSLIDAYSLGEREAEITIMLLNGLSVKRIAQQLDTSEKTVQTQVKNLMQKIGVNRQQDLIRVLLTSSFNTQF